VFATGRRVEGLALAAAIAGGVLWSNVLAYRDVTIAPHDRFAELATINERFEGDAPALMTEFEPYGVRYFLRDLDPEGAGELRRRQIPLRDGSLVAKGDTADIDEVDLAALLVYRTLVLRRSPVASRPPSVYSRVWSGRFYEVWQRPAVLTVELVGRLPLGSPTSAGGRPSCRDVAELAASLRPGGRLLTAPVRPAAVGAVDVARPDGGWARDGDGTFRPLGAGQLEGRVEVPQAGRYELWVGGRTRGRLEASVDGEDVGSVRAELAYSGQFIPLGELDLEPGSHSVRLRYDGPDAAPGSAGSEFGLGPPAVAGAGPPRGLRSYSRERARGICAQTVDWVEAVNPVE
jgi:hypothetical protein